MSILLLILLFKQWADILKMEIVIVMMNYEMRIGLPRRQPSRRQEGCVVSKTDLQLNILYALKMINIFDSSSRKT